MKNIHIILLPGQPLFGGRLITALYVVPRFNNHPIDLKPNITSSPSFNNQVHGNGISLISKELHPLASRGGGQRSNSHELEKTYSCLRGATGGKKPLSPRGKRRARTSVPSLKFALNEVRDFHFQMVFARQK